MATITRERAEPRKKTRGSSFALVFVLALIGMAVIFFAAVAVDRSEIQSRWQNALNHPIDFFDMMRQGPPQNGIMSAEVVEWPLINISGQSHPKIVNMWYLEYFGTAQKGDKLMLLWTNEVTNCLRFHPDWVLYPAICGLEPLPQQ